MCYCINYSCFGLDSNMLSHLLGSLYEEVVTYNICIWLSVKY